MFDITRPNNNLMLLSPWLRSRIEAALRELHAAGHELYIFEGFRSLQRSNYLYEQGRTREGTIVTKAKAWQSFHNYGLACDLWPKKNNRWVFDYNYEKPAVIMRKHGFKCGIDFGDNPHFQLDGGMTWQECKTITEMHGLPCLWQEVELRIIDKLPKVQTLS